jgi:tRNA(His) guanylyltransferase
MINSLEEMRIFERYNEISILSDCFFAIRVDGRSFHTEVKKMKMERPFDKKLINAINKAVKEVMKDFGSVFAYTESDEVTFLFPKSCEFFDRRVEKLVSLVASKMSVEFAKSKIARGTSPTFDARVLELPSDDLVIKCFQWRQMDSHRNAISTQCFWRLVKSGETERSATRLLNGMKDADKNELLFSKFNCNYNNTPEWTRKGTMFYIKEYSKKGFNPLKKEEVKAIRKKIVTEVVKVHFRADNLNEWINKGIKVLSD